MNDGALFAAIVGAGAETAGTWAGIVDEAWAGVVGALADFGLGNWMIGLGKPTMLGKVVGASEENDAGFSGVGLIIGTYCFGCSGRGV
jgi:hypothetical protein